MNNWKECITWNENNQNLLTIHNPFNYLLGWPIWIQRVTRHLILLKINFLHQWKYCLMKVIRSTSSARTCLSIVSHTQTMLLAKISLVSKGYKYLKVKHFMHWTMMEFTIAKSRWTKKDSRGEQTSTKAYKMRTWIFLTIINGTLKVEMVMELLEVH